MLKAHAWKACKREIVSGVRIPSSLQNQSPDRKVGIFSLNKIQIYMNKKYENEQSELDFYFVKLLKR